MDIGWGNPSFHLSQVLTVHGYFGEYLHRIGREATATCHECGADRDTAQHTLEGCPAFEKERRVLVQRISPDLSLPAVIESMLSREENWETVASFCGSIMSRKKAAEKARERGQDDGDDGDYPFRGCTRPQRRRRRRSSLLLREMEEGGKAAGRGARSELQLPPAPPPRAVSGSEYSLSDTPSSR
jgi:hypothetical protein